MKSQVGLVLLLQSLLGLTAHGDVQNKPIQENYSSQIDDGYDTDFIDLLELVYGSGFLSQGGTESVDEMFLRTNLNGIKALDLGSGLGMVDLYLTVHNKMELIGVDPSRLMVQKASESLQLNKAQLVGSLSFALMEDPNSLQQFADSSFDLVFSKESILHVPLETKLPYFQEIFRVLKPGGSIIIADWMHSSPQYSLETKKMMEMDDVPFQLLTQSEYEHILQLAGFKNIEFRDTTSKHAAFSQQNIDTIHLSADQIKNRFGNQTYEYSLESWGYQKNAFETRELITGIFNASKQ